MAKQCFIFNIIVNFCYIHRSSFFCFFFISIFYRFHYWICVRFITVSKITEKINLTVYFVDSVCITFMNKHILDIELMSTRQFESWMTHDDQDKLSICIKMCCMLSCITLYNCCDEIDSKSILANKVTTAIRFFTLTSIFLFSNFLPTLEIAYGLPCALNVDKLS